VVALAKKNVDQRQRAFLLPIDTSKKSSLKNGVEDSPSSMVGFKISSKRKAELKQRLISDFKRFGS
jgi:hypothetical protein